MLFGVSYYPELVPQEQWAADLDEMLRWKLTVVRMLEFAWTWFEPREGEYDFAPLDRFLELVQQRGMKVILGTPTASPPAWLWRQFPEMGCVLRNGQRLGHGARRTACVNSSVYRHFSRNVAAALGKRYGRHPAVIGWQIDNELIGPEVRSEFVCHCGDCQWRFRDWLKQRYASVRALNGAWGQGFWSLDFSDWGEVTTPQHGACLGHQLDAYRFYSDSQVEYLKLQYDALRAVISPRQFISHNSTGIFDRGIDHVAYARALDVGGWDAYWGAAAAGHPASAAFAALAHDLFRSALHKPFWVFETNTNGGLTPAYLAEMRARGACGVIFWHWRQHRANMEQNNAAFCDHAGRPNVPLLQTVLAAIDRLSADGELTSAIPPRQAAILYTPDGVRAQHRCLQRPIPYLDAVITAYQPLWRLGVAMDVVGPDDDLSAYRLVVMPALALMSPSQAANIARFVEGGGVLLAVGPTAHMDLHGVYYPERGQPLLDLLGVRVSPVQSLDGPTTAQAAGATLTAGRCEELLEPTAAQVIAQFTSPAQVAGRPAAVERRARKGYVLYAAAGGGELGKWLSRRAAEAAGVPCLNEPPEGVVVCPHLDCRGRWYLNYSGAACTVEGRSVPAGDFVFVPAPAAQG